MYEVSYVKWLKSLTSDVRVYRGPSLKENRTKLISSAIARCLMDKNTYALVLSHDKKAISADGNILDICKKISKDIPEITVCNSPRPTLEFKNGSKLVLSYIDETPVNLRFGGSQWNYIGIDDIDGVTKEEVFFFLSRNRGANGASHIIDITCGTEIKSDSFVGEVVKWYVDEKGYPLRSRMGNLIFYYPNDNKYAWSLSEFNVESPGKNLLVYPFHVSVSNMDDNFDIT